MSIDGVQRRRQIVEEFKRRRTRELIAIRPFMAAVFVLYQIFHDPRYQVGGLSGRPLLLLHPQDRHPQHASKVGLPCAVPLARLRGTAFNRKPARRERSTASPQDGQGC